VAAACRGCCVARRACEPRCSWRASIVRCCVWCGPVCTCGCVFVACVSPAGNAHKQPAPGIDNEGCVPHVLTRGTGLQCAAGQPRKLLHSTDHCGLVWLA
jgi:hypothetical protein